MKYNNIDTLVTALEKNVNELAEAREEMTVLEMAETKLKGEVARLKLELAQTKAKLNAVEEEALLDALRSDRWQKVAEEAEEKVTAFKKCREKDFDYLVHELAYHHWLVARHEKDGDEMSVAAAKSAVNAMGFAINVMYQRYVRVLHDACDSNRLLIEILDDNDIMGYWHWDADCVMGEFKMKVEVK